MSSIDYGSNFETLHAELTSSGATPLDLPIPDDPYHWRRLQFNSLEALDYPVELVKIPIPHARDAYDSYVNPETGAQGVPKEQQALVERQFTLSSGWHLPVVWEPELADWVRHTNPDLARLELSDEQQVALSRHPATVLPGAVDLGLFRMIMSYKETIDRENPPRWADGQPMISARRLACQCFVTAFDRFVAMAEDAPYLKETEEGRIDRVDIALRRSFKGRFFKEGVHQRQLEAILIDFYVMLGSAVPRFADLQNDDN